MTDPGIAPPHASPAETDLMSVALLHDLVRWRESLVRSLARNNLALRSDGIMTATNRVLIPLLFLRAAEDRNLLPAGTLEDLRDFHTVPAIIGRLSEYADPMYSGSFPASSLHHDPRTGFVTDEHVIRKILDQITTPGRQYDLAVMETTALSGILMQYLSRTVRRSAAHMATVVDTHDTVLTGGTTIPPLTLTEYLVHEAIASARKNRSRREVLPLRILDPACGAGTLLLIVYRALCEDAGIMALPFDERRDILLHSIHGVDVNPHAVAAARMLLVLELFGSPGTVPPPLDFTSAARSATGLQHNILCGNALVGPEIEQDESWMFCPAPDRQTLRPFSYHDRFPEVITAGGFDCILCNPPEGPPGHLEWIQRYFQRMYATYHPPGERSAFFLERALSLVIPGGTVAMILGNRWLRGAAGSPLRELLAARHIEEIADLGAVPAGAGGAGFSLIRVRETRPSRSFAAIAGTAAFVADPGAAAPSMRFPARQEVLGSGGWVLADTRSDNVLEKIFRHGTPLTDIVMGQVYRGVEIREGDPFVIESARARDWIQRDPRCKPLLRPVFRAAPRGTGIEPAGTFHLLIPRDWTCAHMGAEKNPWQYFRRRHPLLARYLKPYANLLKERAVSQPVWWESNADEFWARPRKKIFFCYGALRPEFRYDTGRGICDESLCAVPASGTCLLGLLRSRLIAFVIRKMHEQQPVGHSPMSDLGRVPVIVPDHDCPADRARHNRLERNVQKRMGLERQLISKGEDPENGALQEKIRKIDATIDAQVYALYGLTSEEIAVIEGTSPS